MATKRLTLYSGSWFPAEGGAERQLREVCVGLTDYGWHTTVVTGSGAAESTHSGLSVVRVGPRAREAFRAGLATDPDVSLGSLVGAMTVGGMLAAKARSVPFVLRLGGSNLARFHSTPTRRAMGKALLLGCDVVVVNSPHLRTQVDRVRPLRAPEVRLVRNGVQVPEVVAGQRTGPLTALYYTNAGAEKNDEDFVEVVRRAPEVVFRVVGAVDHLPDLPNLRKVGRTQDVGSELVACDLVLNTSVFEGSPNFCLQALATGRPVLAFGNPGVLDLAQAWPEDVQTIEVRDVDAFVRALRSGQWREHVVARRPANMEQTVQEWDALLRQAGRDQAPVT